MKHTINRADVFYANLKSDGTSRQSGIRPIIVISNSFCNRYSPIISILTCTTSRTKRPLPTHISLPAAETGMKYDSICLCEQPMSIAKDDLLEFITSLSDEHMEKVNVQGKELLKTQEKFYLADSSFKFSVLGYNDQSVAAMLENVVYLELLRRGYEVCIGKTPNGEIDFVATRQNDKLYIQITKEIKSEKTEKREYDRLLEINDNYPKYLLTADDFEGGNYQGIKTMHIADFLLSKEY